MDNEILKLDKQYSILPSDYRNIVNALPYMGIYIITEKDHRILFYNKQVRNSVPHIKLGDICDEVWAGGCSHCPLRSIGDRQYSRVINYEPRYDKKLDVAAVRIMWQGKIPAFMIFAMPYLEDEQIRVEHNYYYELLKQNGILDKPCEEPLDPMMDYTATDKTKLFNGLHDVYGIVGERGTALFSTDANFLLGKARYSLICKLLKENNGVGIMEGYFDDNYTVGVMSGLALTLLGYNDMDDFQSQTNGQMKNCFKPVDYAVFKAKIKFSSSEPWGINMIGKNGEEFYAMIHNVVVETDYGSYNWGLSVRRYEVRDSDLLTNAHNRVGFIKFIKDMKKKGQYLTKFSLLHINIKNFKAINQLYGFEEGDSLLRRLYMRFFNSKLFPLCGARFEGDQFVFLVEKRKLRLNVLRELLHFDCAHGDKTSHIYCICGIYHIVDEKMEISSMLDCAKIAMQSIVDEHNHPYYIYEDSLVEEFVDKAEILANFRNAIQNDEFKVYYQPVINADTGKIISAEALVRWQTADGKFMLPGLFIPTLEKYGYITDVDGLVIDKVYEFLDEREMQGLKNVPIAINLSRMDMHDIKFMQRICDRAQEVQHYGLVMYEITESTYADIENEKSNILQELSTYGVKILLDDFGTGFSSFGMINKFNFDVLKLDRSFIVQLLENPRTRIIVKSVIDMCKNLGVRTTAEGVETEEQLNILKEIGCSYIQGYYYSKPLSEVEFIKFLETHI